MNISVYGIEAWICVCLVVRWVSSFLVERGLLRRFARTLLPFVADVTRSLARLLMGISDSAKRLLAPPEAVDEIAIEARVVDEFAIEDGDMEETTIKDRLFRMYSGGRRELLQTVVEFTHFYADLLKITADVAQHLLKTMDDPRAKCWLHAGAFICQVGSTLLLYHLAWTYLWILLSKCLRCVTVCAMVDSVAVCQ
jgi:hypothetical protein